MARRDVIDSIKNAAFGVVATGSVIITTTTPLVYHDIASATTTIPSTSTTTNDAMILMDGTTSSSSLSQPSLGWMTTTTSPSNVFSSSPTTLYMAQLTPKQQINNAKNYIQANWQSWILSGQWSTISSSYTTQNSIIRFNANTIVNQNPSNNILKTRRSAMYTQLDLVKSAIDAQNETLGVARTQTLITRIQDFLNAAPNP
jgi:hypothetical protein